MATANVHLIRSIRLDEFFFPDIPVGLINRIGENKCWANSTAQTLKACPSFRNHLFQKLSGASVTTADKDFWDNRRVYAFWASFLYNELLDKTLSMEAYILMRNTNKEVAGFFAEKNYKSTRFSAIEMPWSCDAFGYTNSGFSTTLKNPLEEATSGFVVLDTYLRLREEGIVCSVCFDHEKSVGQSDDRPFIIVTPLKPFGADEVVLYSQLDAKDTCIKHRIELLPEYYKEPCLQKELQAMETDGIFEISAQGKILIVCVEVKLSTIEIGFVKTGENAVAQGHQDDVNGSGGFQVQSKFTSPEVVFLQNYFYLLTSTIMNTIDKHFVANVCGNMDQKWLRMDDDRIIPLNGDKNLWDCKKLTDPNNVCFVYEKILLTERVDRDALKRTLSVANKKGFVLQNELRLRRYDHGKDLFSRMMKRYCESSFFRHVTNLVDTEVDPEEERVEFDVSDLHHVRKTTGVVYKNKKVSDDAKSTSKGKKAIAVVEKNSSSSNGKKKIEGDLRIPDSVDIDMNEKDFTRIEDDDVVGTYFYTLEGVKPVKGLVQEVLLDVERRVFYKAFFNIDNTYVYYMKNEMRKLLLNTSNGTIFEGIEREYLLNGVRDWRPKKGVKEKKKYKPDEIQFLVKWGKDAYNWCDYNYTQFHVDKMSAFIKNSSDLSYPSFMKHYHKETNTEWMKYKFCPSTKGDHFKIILGDGTELVKSMEESVEYFGEETVERMQQQYEALSKNAKNVYFHAATGEEVSKGGRLDVLVVPPKTQEKIEICSWFVFEDNKWFKVQVLRTSGGFCVIASVLNACPESNAVCELLFEDMKKWHVMDAEVKVGLLFYKLQQIRLETCCFQFEKFKKLITFEDLFPLLLEKCKGAVTIVAYLTLNNTTHCISWDSVNKKILDPDLCNANVFMHEATFTHSCSRTRNLMSSLQTRIDIPCVMYIGHWWPRREKKKKACSLGIDSISKKKKIE